MKYIYLLGLYISNHHSLIEGIAEVDNVDSPAIHSIQHPRFTIRVSTLIAVICMKPVRSRTSPSISLLAACIRKNV